MYLFDLAGAPRVEDLKTKELMAQLRTKEHKLITIVQSIPTPQKIMENTNCTVKEIVPIYLHLSFHTGWLDQQT